ncbi:MAG TPA: benzoate--CoA ligase, partial [Tabrizicola sp.]|nr:benzoate--CoA ligase [Tabrizicola sp.]
MWSEIDTRPFPQAPAAFNLAGHVLSRAAALDKPALTILHPERDETLTYAELLHFTQTTATALLSCGLT